MAQTKRVKTAYGTLHVSEWGVTIYVSPEQSLAWEEHTLDISIFPCPFAGKRLRLTYNPDGVPTEVKINNEAKPEGEEAPPMDLYCLKMEVRDAARPEVEKQCQRDSHKHLLTIFDRI